MKKILHISKYYYPYYGGIEDVVYTIVNELKPYFDQRIICFNHEKGTTYTVDDVDILRIGTCLRLASQPITLSYRRKLKRMIDSYKPDYIHIHLPNPLISTYLLSIKLHGAKIILHWHADILGQQFFYRFYKPIEKKLLERSYKIIATSELYRQYSSPLEKFSDKISIIPNVVNDAKLDISETEASEIVKIKERYDQRKIVFFVGRHVFYKGVEYLIEAEKRIREDCVIVIAGEGDQTPKLRKKSVNNSRINFIGRIPNNELKHYLHASDVFAFPSCNRSEAFGVVLAEALYCGLPAVSFNIQGSGTLWVNKHNYTGLVVENRNVVEFANAISKILSSDELRSGMSTNAKEWISSNFLKKSIMPVVLNIYT